MAARQLARPPYVDPNTNIIYDTDNPEYQGYLTKQSMWLKVRAFVFFRLRCVPFLSCHPVMILFFYRMCRME
jgi:hypothetical protein